MEMTSEFWQCLRIATEAFGLGIMLREFAPDAFGKWIGRWSVFTSYWLMACFAAYSTTQCVQFEKLAKGNNAPTIADQIADVVPDSDLQGNQFTTLDDAKGNQSHPDTVGNIAVRTAGGLTVSWGPSGAVRSAGRRDGRGGGFGGFDPRSIRGGNFTSADADTGIHAVPNDAPVRF